MWSRQFIIKEQKSRILKKSERTQLQQRVNLRGDNKFSVSNIAQQLGVYVVKSLSIEDSDQLI